jgi:hypothetical protein
MTETTTAKTWISNSLKAAGLRGRGSVWRMRGPEVQWVVHIDELPSGNRLGVDIGLDLQSATTPQGPTDCPVLLHLENVPFAKDFAVVASLDLDTELAPDRRRQELESVTAALAAYLAEHLTLSAVRAALRWRPRISVHPQGRPRDSGRRGGPMSVRRSILLLAALVVSLLGFLQPGAASAAPVLVAAFDTYTSPR